MTRELVFCRSVRALGLPGGAGRAHRARTINHSLLSVEALRQRGVALLGIAFIGDENADTEATIAQLGG